MATKEVEELARAIEQSPRGPFEIEWSDGHGKIKFQGQTVHENIGTEEEPVRGAPLTLPSTPSDPSWRTNTVKRLLKSSVLTEDPFGSDQRGLTEEQEQERAEERERREQAAEARRETVTAQAEETRRGQQDSTVVLNRMERVFGALNIWKQATQTGSAKSGRGTITEIAKVAYWWGERNKVATLPSSQSAAIQSIRLLYKGDRLGEKALNFWRSFTDEIERAPNRARHYNDMLRRALNIGEGQDPALSEPDDDYSPPLSSVVPPPEPSEEPGPARAALTAELEHERAEREQLREELDKAQEEIRLLNERSMNGAKVPELAFEVLSEMLGQHVTVGGEDAGNLEAVLSMLEEKKERAVELANRVAKAELGIAE